MINPQYQSDSSWMAGFQAIEVTGWDLFIVFAVLSTWSLVPGLATLFGTLPVIALTAMSAALIFGAINRWYYCPSWLAAGWTGIGARTSMLAILGGVIAAVSVIEVIGTGPAVNNVPVHFGLLAITIGPICEETFFRGIIQPMFGRSLGSMPGLLMTSFAFAIAHRPYSASHLICLTLTGMAYGWVRNRFGSTTSSALMHATYNLVLWISVIK